MTVDEALEKLFDKTLSDIEESTLAAVLADESGKSLREVLEAIRACRKVSTIQSFKRCVKKKLGLMPPTLRYESGVQP